MVAIYFVVMIVTPRMQHPVVAATLSFTSMQMRSPISPSFSSKNGSAA